MDSFLDKTIINILRDNTEDIDPNYNEMIKVLSSSGAEECWHKAGTFKHHLISIWRIMNIWKQSQVLCRVALFHSTYSNVYVNLRIIEDREVLSKLIGKEAEEFTFMFCRVNRQKLIYDYIYLNKELMKSNILPKDGIDVPHIENNTNWHLSLRQVLECIVLTIADEIEQTSSWTDEISENDGEARWDGNRPDFLWPGEMKPGVSLHFCSKIAYLLGKNHIPEIVLPPIFDYCSKILEIKDEREARDLYWNVILHKREKDSHNEALEDLTKVCTLNPWIGEPHLLISNIWLLRGKFEECNNEAELGIKKLCIMGSAWDKRMDWTSWLSWARVLKNAALKQIEIKGAFDLIRLGKI